jgi:hypothetical protein
MTGDELAAIQRLDLSLHAMGWALGYRGTRNAIEVAVSRLESGRRVIPPCVGRLA